MSVVLRHHSVVEACLAIFGGLVAFLYWFDAIQTAHAIYYVEAVINTGLAVALIARSMWPEWALSVAVVSFAGLSFLDALIDERLATTPLMITAPLVLFSVARDGRHVRIGHVGVAVAVFGSAFSPLVRDAEAPAWAFLAHVGVVIVAWLLGRRQRSLRAERSREISDARALARQEERVRLSEELHDVVGHGLTVIYVQAASALVDTSGTGLARSMANIKDVAQTTVSEMRALVDALSTHEATPSLTMLPKIIDRVRGSDALLESKMPDVKTLGDWDLALSEAARGALVRAVQEGLTNAIRHGDGSVVSLEMERSEESVHCEIRNGVRGPSRHTSALAGGGRGLASLQSRVHVAGGKIVALQAGDVFVLDVILPRC